MAPSYLRGRNETSHTGPNAPLELTQSDFACSASDETKKLQAAFGLHGEIDEFRRLKVMYPTAFPRELAEFQVFAKAVAARPEDGRGSEDRGEDNREDTGDDRRRGRHSQQRLQGPPRAPPPWPTFCGTQVATTSRWFVIPSPEQRLKRTVNPEDKSWKAFFAASSAAAAADPRSSREDFVHGLPVQVAHCSDECQG